MKKFVVIKTQFPAIHSWPACDIPSVSYLRHSHRHMFHVVMKFQVTHNNREIEFISMNEKVSASLNLFYKGKDLGSKSCEMIAWELMEEFNASFVSVFEDDENGAEIIKD